jgi:hypothetical protein
MNTLLYFPQVKAVVIALTTWELKADRIVPSTQWYFNQGGGVVGLGNAGNGDVTAALNGTVFPIAGNQYKMVDPTWICRNKVTGEERIVPTPRCNADETRDQRRMTSYVKATDHAITQGVADEFSLSDKRFVMHMDTTQSPPVYEEWTPDEGTYTLIYGEKNAGAPLVALYEDNGTSITFTGTDQISVFDGDEAYFGNFVDDDNFVKLFQNAVYYAWSEETKYDAAMASAAEEFQKMKDDEEALKQRVEDSQKKEKNSKLMRSVLIVAVGAVLIVVIAYFSFVVPARQRAAEGPAEEES